MSLVRLPVAEPCSPLTLIKKKVAFCASYALQVEIRYHFISIETKMARLLERHAIAISIVLVLIASVRIVLTWNVFNATIDEGTHIACGMEWLNLGRYQLEDQHPPLARVA